MNITSVDDFIKAIEEDAANFADTPAFKTSFTINELINLNLETIPCLFGDIIPACGVWTLVGSSDTGKSMLLRQLALNCIKGEDFLGWQNNAKHKKAIFISTEDDPSSTAFLVRKQSPGWDGPASLLFNFDSEDVPAYLHQHLQTWPADLVIIDAWSDVFGKDLKDSALIRKTLNVYKSIAAKYQCSIGFLHHTGKRTEKLEPSKNNILSGQGYEAAMRLVIELRADATNPLQRHLCIVKGNYLSNDYKKSSYVLQFNSDTFLFSDTGARVPFEQLKAPEEGFGEGRQGVSFEEINEGVHTALVADIFANKPKLKYAELVVALGETYKAKTKENFVRDKCRQLVGYLVDNDFIEKCGRGNGAWYQLLNNISA